MKKPDNPKDWIGRRVRCDEGVGVIEATYEHYETVYVRIDGLPGYINVCGPNGTYAQCWEFVEPVDEGERVPTACGKWVPTVCGKPASFTYIDGRAQKHAIGGDGKPIYVGDEVEKLNDPVPDGILRIVTDILFGEVYFDCHTHNRDIVRYVTLPRNLRAVKRGNKQLNENPKENRTMSKLRQLSPAVEKAIDADLAAILKAFTYVDGGGRDWIDVNNPKLHELLLQILVKMPGVVDAAKEYIAGVEAEEKWKGMSDNNHTYHRRNSNGYSHK